MSGDERRRRVQSRIREEKWDLLACALPSNVLMLSGYWPIVGTGVAVAASDGSVTLLVPEDEEELARRSWASEVRTFQPGSLDTLQTAAEALREPLSRMVGGRGSIGFEHGEVSEPASYVAMNLYSGAMRELLASAAPHAQLSPADSALAELKSRKTPEEIDAIRRSVDVAAKAFTIGAASLKAGATEAEAAAAFNAHLGTLGMNEREAERAGGHVSCMSGTRSGHAYGAFARSTGKQITPGDLVLTHCNSQVNGYWTDITRTFTTGEFTHRKQEMYSALFAARDAALAGIEPGVAARDVDRAARGVMEQRGFATQFKHPTGHGVGFGAIDAHAKPRLHPKSLDRIEPGMVFNVEPGIYFEDFGGMRQCEMVAMTENGMELLTRFQSAVEDLKR